jgi:hypothetical protein
METLKIRAATVSHDGKTYEFVAGPVPDDTPAAVIAQLRDEGSLAASEEEAAGVGVLGAPVDPTSVASGGKVGEPDPDLPENSGGDQLPDDAPDIDTADVATIAQYIDAHNLNASQTVALAGGTAAGAAKVLEAERVSSGGDGRSTVVKPLSKLAAGESAA